MTAATPETPTDPFLSEGFHSNPNAVIAPVEIRLTHPRGATCDTRCRVGISRERAEKDQFRFFGRGRIIPEIFARVLIV